MKRFFLFTALCCLSHLSADPVLVIAPNGDFHEMEANLKAPFGQVLSQAALSIGAESSESINLIIPDYVMKSAKKSDKFTRDFNRSLSSQDQKDVQYIVKTLAWSPVTKLLSHKSSLNKAGDRIRPIHPLNFLGFVFTNEEMKAGVHAIRQRTTLVWDNFFGGLKESLSDEAKIGNLTDAQVAAFCQKVGIDYNVVIDSIRGHNWQHFFDLLLHHIPRTEDPNRYNM